MAHRRLNWRDVGLSIVPGELARQRPAMPLTPVRKSRRGGVRVREMAMASLARRRAAEAALLHSSHMYHEAKSSFAHHGVKFSNLEVDLPAMMAQKDKAVSGLTKGIEGLFKKNKVEYVKGFGKLVSPSEVSVDLVDGGSTIVKGKNIIVATGSDVKSLPGVTIDEKKIVSSTGALALTEIPKKLVVIGAGYIGLEMGSVWNRLGSEVTVVEFAPDIVPSMDGEIRKQFQRMLEKQKFKFMLKTKVVGVDTSGSGVKLTVEPAAGGEQTVIEADVVLVSAGRVPYTAGIGLDAIGVETDKGGRVLVDNRFMTNVKGVYAIGDAIPGPMLAHKAEEDGVACVEFIAGKEGHVDYDTVPGVVYTHPEVASVGKTEEQVKASGVAYQVGKFPLLANSRAKAIDDAEGMVKFLCSCWDIIKHDICAVFHKLYSLNGCGFQKLNEAFVTLLPKRPDAASIADYRPISLIHLIAKLVAKVLSLRLAP
ncbi:Dihydrolipoyl dehydrogenase 1, mitochondrial [Triticum urartu]|uniref:Dihydrolipoyl dehydrogenase 1, mitochondrial n=1 Tax=Triticum urartu TaxID=4572 RepID=M8B253_TRIUA|nr:Dihydrolipoyl dehydrogenase 1, mitochondrial [Triticum urartu]